MRNLTTAAALLALTLGAAACSKPEQQDTQADAKAAGEELKGAAVNLGNELKLDTAKSAEEIKAMAKDPEVKKAAAEVKESLKGLGVSIKNSARNDDAPAGATTTTTTTTVEKK